MYEKVNPCHPDKVADRIAGALVDLAYQKEDDPRIAAEVLLGHGFCYIIVEGSRRYSYEEVEPIVDRICEEHLHLRLISKPQDPHLAENQRKALVCGDNGIFRGVPINGEERMLADVVGMVFGECPSDGKYILDGNCLIACQSNMDEAELRARTFMDTAFKAEDSVANPLGFWTGGPDVDAGATNRKLGSDMGRAVTGGGLHGKDLSKADVSLNILCHLVAQEKNAHVSARCAIGDATVQLHVEETGALMEFPYETVVRIARDYIESLGGFETFAEWGLIRPIQENWEQ